jgi:cell division protein FtsN
MAAKQSGSRWVWIILLLIIGSFAAFVFFLDTKIDKGKTPKPAEATQKKDDKPRIDFYKILPDRKVDIPISEEDQQAIENPSINKQADEEIILQVGSFQSAAEADSLKAQLAFLGLEANVKSAVVNDDTWYRVMLGPFGANSELSRTQNLLLENRIQYMRRSATP